MKRSFAMLLGIAAAILAVDQWTKRWAEDTLAHRAPVNVLGEIVRLTYTRNSGVAFGLGAGLPFPYAVFSIAAVVAILYLYARHREYSRLRQVALALILGGALGNLVDRLASGEVVDFILIGWRRWYWPVFNVADSAVTIGVVLFGITWMQHEQPARPNDDGSPDAAESPALGSSVRQGGASGSLSRPGADRPVA